MQNNAALEPVTLGARQIGLDQVVSIARQGVPVKLSEDPAWTKKIHAGAAFLQERLQSEAPLYGVNTGYGASCGVKIPPHLVPELPLHLIRYHGCGLGRPLTEQACAAVIVARLTSLSMGYSGVRMEILERLVDLLNRGIFPIIPEEGSVGASGDLTPLSYVAAALLGERTVTYKGQVVKASDALAKEGLEPVTLLPKEGLALMNGTSVMTGLACLAFDRAQKLLRLSAHISALAVEAFLGNRDHYHPDLFAKKPFRGQAQVADWIYQDLSAEHILDLEHPVQDRYSLRCAPHVLGVLADALPWMKEHIEIELNSANDNPLIDGMARKIYHGGHFYGGHIAFVMDSMKTAVANVADLLDRQVALLTDPKSNNGLPGNLSGAVGERAVINHGFKAMQISISAWTAEALKGTMPASVFSRSTENHNQDKVSMGTIAARDAVRVIELTEQVAAGSLLAMNQALSMRLRDGAIQRDELRPSLVRLHDEVNAVFPLLEEDRPMQVDLENILHHIRHNHLGCDS
ncbi:MAG: aromatic amino acid ammonia-lyase [Kiritimatiellae bacterium]|nr:aromatic amino acid ammonia-lyase [Kiritimatiellia bacterium]